MAPDMRGFWDRRARESPFFFVDSRLDYRTPDLPAFWAQGERDLARLLSQARVRVTAADTVVEVGCGVGRLTRPLSARVARVLAVDVSHEMLAVAREHSPERHNVTWLLGDGESLSGVDDGSADACVSHVVFQHIPDPAVTLGYVREMGRVLRPGGWAAFQVSNDPAVHRPRARAGSGLRALLGRGPRGQSAPEWLGSAVDLDELRGAASDGGLAVEHIEGEGTQFCLVVLRAPLTRPIPES